MQWCPECGAAHESWAVSCVFCGAELVDHPVELVQADDVDHDVAHLPLEGVDDAARAQLAWLLESSEVPHELQSGEVSVPAVHVAFTAQLIDEVRVGAPGLHDGDVELDGAATRGPTRDGTRVTATGTRVGARVVNELISALLVTAVVFAVSTIGPSLGTGTWVSWLMLIVVDVALVATFGWNLGKLVIGLRVTDEHGHVPGWRRAAIRAAVLFGPYFAIGVLATVLWDRFGLWGPVVVMLPLLWIVAVIWSIGAHPRHQGWHDRAAGTYVVDRR